jgi:hypothetical protein
MRAISCATRISKRYCALARTIRESAYHWQMATTTAAEAREYLAGLALASDHEIEELRRAPLELKLRQIWSLMHAAILRGDDAHREAEVVRLRNRWAALYQAARD